MRYLVTYWTQTGNTQKVAEAIYDALPGLKELRPFSDVDSLDGYDLTFIGFPVMQFGPPRAVRMFMAELAAGKKTALFVTHAMLSNSEDQQQQFLLAKELEKCRSACSKSELIGVFHCQGELSEKVADELMASKIPMLMEFAGMRPLTAGHPNPAELMQAKNFALSIISTLAC